MEERKKIIVVCGPTASGKTSLAIMLAQQFNGEIISADSMQVYKNLDIGTAKPTRQEQLLAKHHLIDFLTPDENYNVEIFTRLAKEKIKEITNKGKVPIIAGGTGLYIESLINGINFACQKDTTNIKKDIQNELSLNGKEWLYTELVKIDPEYAKTVHPNNIVRVMRVIELYRASGINMTQQIANSRPAKPPYDCLVFALNYLDRKSLYNNIDKRVDIMAQNGLQQEARYVYDNKDVFINSAAAIGYKEFFSYFEDQETFSQSLDKLKQSSRNYAKRQLTWFKRMQNINWIYVDDTEDYKEKAIGLTNEFLGE